jgi:plasmid stability protein
MIRVEMEAECRRIIAAMLASDNIATAVRAALLDGLRRRQRNPAGSGREQLERISDGRD